MPSMPNVAVLQGESRHASSAKQQQSALRVRHPWENCSFTSFSAFVSTLNHQIFTYFVQRRSPLRSCYHLNLKQAFKVKNLVPMTIHHGGCHWSRALYQVAVAHAYAKKTPVPKIKVILSLFSSHNTNVPQRSSQAKTRQKRQWGRLQKSLSSVSSSIWPMWSTFLSVTDKTLIIHW